MTVRRKPTLEGDPTDPNELQIVKWGLGTKSFRVAILVLVLSMHPMGRQLLGTFGFEFPDQRKLTIAADEAKKAQEQVSTIVQALTDIKRDVDSIKANNAILNSKVDKLEVVFTGFQVDFQHYKTPNEK